MIGPFPRVRYTRNVFGKQLFVSFQELETVHSILTFSSSPIDRFIASSKQSVQDSNLEFVLLEERIETLVEQIILVFSYPNSIFLTGSDWKDPAPGKNSGFSLFCSSMSGAFEIFHITALTENRPSFNIKKFIDLLKNMNSARVRCFLIIIN
jgi:hypothetical protein